MRFRRQRDDEVEIVVLEIVERFRRALAERQPVFGQHGVDEGIAARRRGPRPRPRRRTAAGPVAPARSAIGERTAFMPHMKSTERGKARRQHQPRQCSTQTSVNSRRAVSKSMSILPGEPVHQRLRAFVVQAAPAHVDRLDLAGRRRADRLVVALADHVIVLDDPPERRQRQDVGDDRLAALARDREHQPALDQRQLQPVGPVAGIVDRAEAVLLDEVEDGDGALVLDIGRRAADRFVELDVDQPCVAGRSRPGHAIHRLRRIATERPCASSPSALASAIAAGASVPQLLGAELEDRGALHEVEHRQARREARRAGGRQHVVGAADIVADHLRRVAAEEDRAGIADAATGSLRRRRSPARHARPRCGRRAAPPSSRRPRG